MKHESLKPPIILFGNVRSGTSMMRDLFGLHPEVATWNEPRTVWAYAAPWRRHDRFDERDARPGVIRYIRKRFLKYQREHGNRRIFEKTPSNVLRIAYVNRIFPEARFIYIVREPLANLSSSEHWWQAVIHRGHIRHRLHETPTLQLPFYAGRLASDLLRKKILGHRYVSVWGVRYPGIHADLRRLSTEQIIAKQWVACAQQAEADLARIAPERVVRLRYEDFVANPQDCFERLLQHTGLDMTPEIEQGLRTVDPARQQKWHRLDETVLRRCLPILAPQMQHYGYHVPEDLQYLADPQSEG